MSGGRRVTQGFRYFALRAVGKPPMKDFKPESAVIHSLLSIDVFDPGAENGQEGGDSESIDPNLEASIQVQARNNGPLSWLCQENREQ